MPIVRMTDFIGFYRHLAVVSDFHALSGRGDDLAATEFTNGQILSFLDLVPEDTLLDLGCGDGCLLRLAESLVQKRVGIAPNVEEVLKLSRELPAISFQAGTIDKLPLDSESFSKIVCNSVMLLLGSEEAAMAALREIARVARPKARVWLGEIPAIDELSAFRKYRGNSVVGFLQHGLRRNGIKGLMSCVREVTLALISDHILTLNSANLFYSSPEGLISMAQKSGFRMINYFKHQRLHRSGKIVESPYRYDYIVERLN